MLLVAPDLVLALDVDKILADDARILEHLYIVGDVCQCQNWQISGRGSRTMHLRIKGNRRQGHGVYLGSGPLDGGNTLRPA